MFPENEYHMGTEGNNEENTVCRLLLRLETALEQKEMPVLKKQRLGRKSDSPEQGGSVPGEAASKIFPEMNTFPKENTRKNGHLTIKMRKVIGGSSIPEDFFIPYPDMGFPCLQMGG